jgi:hypothetical protein
VKPEVGSKSHGTRIVAILREKCRNFQSEDLPLWRAAFAESYRHGPTAVGPAVVAQSG